MLLLQTALAIVVWL